MSPRSLTALPLALLLAGALTACGEREDEPEPVVTPTPDGEPVSILRPDVEIERPVAPLEPLATTITFAEGGSTLGDDAVATLEDVLASDQFEEGGAITLRAHSDAGGSDEANMRASTARAEAVRDWLVENGADAERITIIAFGEQNPIEPNALPDGTPNEEGRAANRRVELTIDVPEETADDSGEIGAGDSSADAAADPAT